jgi:hypothetical protein
MAYDGHLCSARACCQNLQTAAEFAEPWMRMRGGWLGIVSGMMTDTASIAQASEGAWYVVLGFS